MNNIHHSEQEKLKVSQMINYLGANAVNSFFCGKKLVINYYSFIRCCLILANNMYCVDT